jgi:hypothetical protein
MQLDSLKEIIDLVQKSLGTGYSVSYSSNGLMVQLFKCFNTQNNYQNLSHLGGSNLTVALGPSIIEADSFIIFPTTKNLLTSFTGDARPIIEELYDMLDVLRNKLSQETFYMIKEKIKEHTEMKDVLDTL